jgi:protein-tyrosine phosphatase
MLRDLYGGILAHSGPLLGELLGALADPGALPAVFHCTGGKDRTGMAAALLLELLGVSRQDILDDYELTARFRTRVHQGESYESLIALGMAPEAAAAVLGTPRWAMEETLDELDASYDGVEAYLLGPAGMEPSGLERLRDSLVG